MNKMAMVRLSKAFLVTAVAMSLVGCQGGGEKTVELPKPGGYLRFVNATDSPAEFKYADNAPVLVEPFQATEFAIASSREKDLTASIDGSEVATTKVTTSSKENLTVILDGSEGSHTLTPLTGEKRDTDTSSTSLYVMNLSDDPEVTLATGDKSISAPKGSLVELQGIPYGALQVSVDGKTADVEAESTISYTAFVFDSPDGKVVSIFPNKVIIEVTGAGGASPM